MSDVIPDGYSQFLANLKSRFRAAQYQALRAANKELLKLYWEIGESIHRKQKEVGWGKSVVERWPAISKRNSPAETDFRPAICGLCGSYMQNTAIGTISNHWLEKSVGPRISSSWPAARTIWNGSSTQGPGSSRIGPESIASINDIPLTHGGEVCAANTDCRDVIDPMAEYDGTGAADLCIISLILQV